MGDMSVATVSLLTAASVSKPVHGAIGALGRFALGQPLLSVFLVVREVDSGGCKWSLIRFIVA